MTTKITNTVLKRALSRTSLSAMGNGGASGAGGAQILFSGTGSFDSANGKLVSIDGDTVACEITPDPFTKGTDEKAHSQWFNFSVSNIGELGLSE